MNLKTKANLNFYSFIKNLRGSILCTNWKGHRSTELGPPLSKLYNFSNDQGKLNSCSPLSSILCKGSSTKAMLLKRLLRRQFSTKTNAIFVWKNREELDFNCNKLFWLYIRTIWLGFSVFFLNWGLLFILLH